MHVLYSQYPILYTVINVITHLHYYLLPLTPYPLKTNKQTNKKTPVVDLSIRITFSKFSEDTKQAGKKDFVMKMH